MIQLRFLRKSLLIDLVNPDACKLQRCSECHRGVQFITWYLPPDI